MLSWISSESYREDRVRVTGLEGPLSRADLVAENSDDRVSTVLVKPHRDAVQKLSIEYARLVRENERLRGVIRSAVNILDGSANKEIKKG